MIRRWCTVLFLLLLLSSQRAFCESRKNTSSTNIVIPASPVIAEKPVKPVLAASSTNVSHGTLVVTAPAVAVTTTTTRRPFFQGVRTPCSCDEGQCGCCTGVILERFRQKACMNFTYDPDDFAITATMYMNERVIYKNTFSGKNPAPMCVRVPRFRFIELCVEVSNVYLASRNIHMCVDAEASWEDFTLVEWSFDCFRLGASGVAIVRPEDGGGLPGSPIDEVDQTDEDYDDSARDGSVRNEKRSPGSIFVVDSKDNVPVLAREVRGDVQFNLKDRGNFFSMDKYLDFWL